TKSCREENGRPHPRRPAKLFERKGCFSLWKVNQKDHNLCAAAIVEQPRATCSTRLLVSTWSSFIRQASDTRKPCRNIRSNKQWSRTSFLLPLGASIKPLNLREVMCFWSLISASP